MTEEIKKLLLSIIETVYAEGNNNNLFTIMQAIDKGIEASFGDLIGEGDLKQNE